MPDLDTLLASSMTALLENSETRKAIVDYIQALTDKNKPTEQWREVYWMQSEESRFTKESYEAKLGIPPRKFRLLVKAYWDDKSGVGMFRASMTNENDYGKRNILMGYDDYYPFADLANDVIKADNYKEVIEYLIKNWYEIAHDKWVEITKE